MIRILEKIDLEPNLDVIRQALDVVIRFCQDKCEYHQLCWWNVGFQLKRSINALTWWTISPRSSISQVPSPSSNRTRITWNSTSPFVSTPLSRLVNLLIFTRLLFSFSILIPDSTIIFANSFTILYLDHAAIFWTIFWSIYFNPLLPSCAMVSTISSSFSMQSTSLRSSYNCHLFIAYKLLVTHKKMELKRWDYSCFSFEFLTNATSPPFVFKKKKPPVPLVLRSTLPLLSFFPACLHSAVRAAPPFQSCVWWR